MVCETLAGLLTRVHPLEAGEVGHFLGQLIIVSEGQDSAAGSDWFISLSFHNSEKSPEAMGPPHLIIPKIPTRAW